MLGTLVNVAAVAAGSLIGITYKDRIAERYTQIVFQALGLFTLVIGMQMALDSQNVLIVVFSLLLGGLVGEWLKIERGIERLGALLKKKGSSDQGRFQEGILTGFLLFCVGSMTVLGAFQEGINDDRSIIYTKSLMDLFSSIALGAALGRGVLFSVIPLFLYQAALTLGASYLQPILSDPMITEMIAVGGVMLIGLGIQILKIRDFRIAHFLPALVFALVFTALAERFGFYAF